MSLTVVEKKRDGNPVTEAGVGAHVETERDAAMSSPLNTSGGTGLKESRDVPRDPDRRPGDNAMLVSSWAHVPAVMTELAAQGHVRVSIPPLPEGATKEQKDLRDELKALLKTIKDLQNDPKKLMEAIGAEIGAKIVDGPKVWEQISGSFDEKKTIRAFVPLSKGSETEDDKIERRMLKKLDGPVKNDVDAGVRPRVMLDEGVALSRDVLRRLYDLKMSENPDLVADIRELKKDGTIRKVGVEELRDRLHAVGTRDDKSEIEVARSKEQRDATLEKQAKDKERVQSEKQDFTEKTKDLHSRVVEAVGKREKGEDAKVELAFEAGKATSREGLREILRAMEADKTGDTLVVKIGDRKFEKSDIQEMLKNHEDPKSLGERAGDLLALAAAPAGWLMNKWSAWREAAAERKAEAAKEREKSRNEKADFANQLEDLEARIAVRSGVPRDVVVTIEPGQATNLRDLRRLHAAMIDYDGRPEFVVLGKKTGVGDEREVLTKDDVKAMIDSHKDNGFSIGGLIESVTEAIGSRADSYMKRRSEVRERKEEAAKELARINEEKDAFTSEMKGLDGVLFAAERTGGTVEKVIDGSKATSLDGLRSIEEAMLLDKGEKNLKVSIREGTETRELELDDIRKMIREHSDNPANKPGIGSRVTSGVRYVYGYMTGKRAPDGSAAETE